MSRLWAGLAIAGMLTGCGGGGSGGPSVSTEVIEADFSRKLLAALEAGDPVSTPVGVARVADDPVIAIDRNLNVTILDGRRQLARFTADDITNANAGVISYNAGSSQDLMLAITPSADPATAFLDHTAFGIWALDAAGDPSIVTGGFGFLVSDAGAGYLGQATPVADIPTSGAALHTGVVVAWDMTGNRMDDGLVGNVTLLADFDAREVFASMALDSTATGLVWGGIDTGAMNLESNRFSTADAQSSRGHTGTVSGQFHGPEAIETGGQFLLRDGDSRLIGAFGTRRLDNF